MKRNAPKKRRGGFRQMRRRFCRFTAEGATHIDYKDLATLKSFVSESGKIIPSRNTGCLLYTSPSPRDKRQSRMPSSA